MSNNLPELIKSPIRHFYGKRYNEVFEIAQRAIGTEKAIYSTVFKDTYMEVITIGHDNLFSLYRIFYHASKDRWELNAVLKKIEFQKLIDKLHNGKNEL